MSKTTTGHRLWQQAAAFAAQYHQGQLRKDGRTPYVSHVFRVAMTVRHVFNCDDETILAAALLHDTIEDTSADYDDLLEVFGTEVADLVAALSKDQRMREDLREAAYDKQLANAPWQARLIKLADMYDNVCDVKTVDQKHGQHSGASTKMRDKAKTVIAYCEGQPKLESALAIVRDKLAECD